MTTQTDSEPHDLTANATRPEPADELDANPEDAGDLAILDPDLRTLSFVASASLIRHLDAAADTIGDARFILAGAVHMLDDARLSGQARADVRLRLETMRRQLDAIAFTARQLAAEVI